MGKGNELYAFAIAGFVALCCCLCLLRCCCRSKKKQDTQMKNLQNAIEQRERERKVQQKKHRKEKKKKRRAKQPKHVSDVMRSSQTVPQNVPQMAASRSDSTVPRDVDSIEISSVDDKLSSHSSVQRKPVEPGHDQRQRLSNQRRHGHRGHRKRSSDRHRMKHRKYDAVHRNDPTLDPYDEDHIEMESIWSAEYENNRIGGDHGRHMHSAAEVVIVCTSPPHIAPPASETSSNPPLPADHDGTRSPRSVNIRIGAPKRTLPQHSNVLVPPTPPPDAMPKKHLKPHSHSKRVSFQNHSRNNRSFTTDSELEAGGGGQHDKDRALAQRDSIRHRTMSDEYEYEYYYEDVPGHHAQNSFAL